MKNEIDLMEHVLPLPQSTFDFFTDSAMFFRLSPDTHAAEGNVESQWRI